MQQLNKKLAAVLIAVAAGSVFYGTAQAEAQEKMKLDNIEIIFRSGHRDRYWNPAQPPPPPPPPHHHRGPGPRHFGPHAHMPPPLHHGGPRPEPRDFGPRGPQGGPGPHTPPPPHR